MTRRDRCPLAGSPSVLTSRPGVAGPRFGANRTHKGQTDVPNEALCSTKPRASGHGHCTASSSTKIHAYLA